MNQFKKYSLLLLPLILGVIALMMAFMPSLIYADTDSTFSGLEVMFGTEFANLGMFGSGQIEPSLLGILAYSLPIIAGLLAIAFPKKTIISTLGFSIASILLILLPRYAVATMTILGETTTLDITWTMGSGLIVSIIASISGVFASIVMILKK